MELYLIFSVFSLQYSTSYQYTFKNIYSRIKKSSAFKSEADLKKEITEEKVIYVRATVLLF